MTVEDIIVRCAGAYSPSTLRNYRTGLIRFENWCAERGRSALPAEPAAVAEFIEEQARTRSVATVKNQLAAIMFAHRHAGLPLPADQSVVQLAVRRVARTNMRRPRQALGLTGELLNPILAACPATLAGLRDAALISVGYDALCRSGELAAMRIEHLTANRERVCIPRSKADPFGDGRVAYLSPPTVQRLNRWLAAAELLAGPLFRGLHTCAVANRALDTSSIRRLIKRAAARADVTPSTVRFLSGHSMRVGAAQDMMVAGIDTVGIMQAGGWRNHQVLARYVENAAAERLHARRWERLALLSALPTAPATGPTRSRRHGASCF